MIFFEFLFLLEYVNCIYSLVCQIENAISFLLHSLPIHLIRYFVTHSLFYLFFTMIILTAGRRQARVRSLGRPTQGLFDWIHGFPSSSSPSRHLSLLESESQVWETTQGSCYCSCNLSERHSGKTRRYSQWQDSRSQHQHPCRRRIKPHLDDRLWQWMVWKGRRRRHLWPIDWKLPRRECSYRTRRFGRRANDSDWFLEWLWSMLRLHQEWPNITLQKHEAGQYNFQDVNFTTASFFSESSI